MATQARSVLQDQNMNLEFKGNGVKESTRVLRSKKNASLGGRKALADLSNSTKPCANNAKNKDKKPAVVRGEIGAYKPTSPPVNGKTIAPKSGNQSTFVGSKIDHSTKLNAFDGNLKTYKLLSPARGKIDVFVEPSDSENSSMLLTKKKSQLGTEFGEVSISKAISSSNAGMPLNHQVSENCNFTTKSKEVGRKALALKSGSAFEENTVQKISSIKGFKLSAQQSVDSHICNPKGRIGGRKALADISNSSSINVRQASKVSHSKNIKAIADEQFLHDHQQCINLQKGAMDMDFIWRTLGLDDGSSQFLSSSTVFPDEVKEKIETPFKKWEDLELAELQVQTPYRFPSPQLLDDCLSSPESVMSPMHWNHDMSPKFTLVDTPLEKQ